MDLHLCFLCPLLFLIIKAILKGVENLMFFLLQSAARLPPIGFSYLEHLGSLVRVFHCKNSIYKP